MPRTIDFTCNGCEATQSFTVWESLNVSLNPEEKIHLLNGNLTTFTCKKCGWSCNVSYPLLYHDMEKHLMVWLWLDAGEPETITLPIVEKVNDYIFRLVSTKHELVEKICIVEFGLDDRVIELFKLFLIKAKAQSGTLLAGELYFTGKLNLSNGGEAVKFIHITDNANEVIALYMESYESTAKSAAKALSKITKEATQWLRVDRQYAENLITQY